MDAGPRGAPVAPAAAAIAPPARGATAPAADGHGWNDAQIAWQPYDAGLARAKAEHKPVCLVIYTSWCPHCKNFSHVFDDPRVVEQAKQFVMIRIDADREEAPAEAHQPDGGYIPRTFFLAPDGTPELDIHAPRPTFKYFYDEHNPGALLSGFAAALQKLK